MEKRNNNSYEMRLNLINKKIEKIDFYVDSIGDQKSNILLSLEKCFKFEEREVYFNNLQLLHSVLLNYEAQRTFLKKKLEEYFSIMSNQNKIERLIFLEIWKKKVDIFFKAPNSFNFDFNEQDYLTEFENDCCVFNSKVGSLDNIINSENKSINIDLNSTQKKLIKS